MFTLDIYVYARICHVCEGVPRDQKRAGITGGDEVSCVGAGKSSGPLLEQRDRAISTALPHKLRLVVCCERLPPNSDQVLKTLE